MYNQVKSSQLQNTPMLCHAMLCNAIFFTISYSPGVIASNAHQIGINIDASLRSLPLNLQQIRSVGGMAQLLSRVGKSTEAERTGASDHKLSIG